MDMRKFGAAGIKEPYHKRLSGTNRRASCQSCIYRRGIGALGSKYTVCHYLLDTGKPRGCPAERCDKKRIRRYSNDSKTD